MKKTKNSNNPFWGEAESQNFGKAAIEYAAGEDVILDQQLVQYECLVNKAHVVMLCQQGLVTKKVAKFLLEGLEEISVLDKQDKFKLRVELEDVHSNVEQYLIKKYGIKVGGYLRLGIARNDQVYTDTIFYLKDNLSVIIETLLLVVKSLAQKAKKELKTIMPGYSHLQISQPITFGHYLIAKAYHLLDDLENLFQSLKHIDKCPLGIVEMSGTHLPIDRKLLANLLGFTNPTENSLYTANQRGENEAKVLADLSLLAMHVRRTIQEIIIFASTEFDLFKIDDLYVTGGTAQPNLKNPDTLEVIRANCPRIYSKFWEVLLIMDIQTSGYNRDTQQTKPALFAALKLTRETLPVFGGILTSLTPNKIQMLKTAQLNFSTAPDVVTQLCVKGGVSFRESYQVVKALIKDGYLQHSFSELTEAMVAEASLKVLKKKLIVKQADIDTVATAEKCVWSHTCEGGPAPSQVKKQINSVMKTAIALTEKIDLIKAKQKQAFEDLEKEVKKIVGDV